MATTTTTPTTSTDPFASIGGGVQLANGSWVPKSHPLAQQQTATAPKPATAPVPTTAPAPAPKTVATQGAAAQTYSATPAAAPAANTTNQGTQDVLRNMYLQRALQPGTIDPNSPDIRQQSDSFSAAAERARRDAVANNAESHAGTGDTGAQGVEQRSINEKAAQARGSFEAQLVGQAAQQRKAEITDALQQLGGMISGDQARALQQELAKLNAQIQQSQIASNEKLGMGSINVDLARALLQNQQANNSLGLQAGTTAAQLNQQAMLSMLGL